MKMSICVATMRPNPNVNGSIERYPGDISLATSNAITYPAVHVQYNTPENNLGVVGSYQKLYEQSTEEILCFMHDDVLVRERGWDERVMKEFDDPAVGLVGFGGGRWHGLPELYKVPYKLQNLIRGNYRSNSDDAEVHGERFTGSCDVAVLDGYCLIVRRGLLDRAGGWSTIGSGCDFFTYDYALSGWARRLGYRIRVVGIRVHHRGGQTSLTKSEITSQEAYDRSHRWYFENFRDVMPCRVNP